MLALIAPYSGGLNGLCIYMVNALLLCDCFAVTEDVVTLSVQQKT
jgi:hypothetical protein